MWILVYDNEDGEYILFSTKGFKTEKEAQKDADNYNSIWTTLNIFPLKLL